MKNGTRNLLFGLGIAAGALLTVKAFTGKTGKRIKHFVAKKVAGVPSGSKDTSNKDTEDFYV